MAQRFKTLSDVAVLLRKLPSERLGTGLSPDLGEKFVAPRFRARLERRFLIQTGVQDSLPELLDSPAERIIALGGDTLGAVILDVGVMCQYATLRRVVDQSALSELGTMLGISLASHDARRATDGDSLDLAREIASPHPVTEDMDALSSAILRDGLQCWACWVHDHPPAVHGFFHALTPSVLIQEEGDTTTHGCRPRDCRRRATLFATRLAIAVAECEETAKEEA